MKKKLFQIRCYLLFFVLALVLSGLTAFPLQTEVQFLLQFNTWMPADMYLWISRISEALTAVNTNYPFLAYGTDWLAFAHLVIAVSFIGPWLDPVRNKWVVLHAIISCVLIWPLAFISGSIRGIPLYWQLIDCSFGVFGLIPLLRCYQLITRLENELQLAPISANPSHSITNLKP